MSRETQNVVLLLLGGALIKITLDGSFLRYVKPSMGPVLFAGGLAIVALAVIAIVGDIRSPAAAGAQDACGGGHEHASRVPWLLVVLVLAIFLIAPPALGSDAAARGSGRNLAPAPGDGRPAFAPLPAGAVLPMRFADVVSRAGWSGGDTLRGRAVRITGFLMHNDSGQPLLSRMVMSCCAADAFPVHALLAGAALPGYRDDQWLQVTGTVVAGTASAANGYTPTLTVLDIRTIPAPADTYEH